MGWCGSPDDSPNPGHRLELRNKTRAELAFRHGRRGTAKPLAPLDPQIPRCRRIGDFAIRCFADRLAVKLGIISSGSTTTPPTWTPTCGTVKPLPPRSPYRARALHSGQRNLAAHPTEHHHAARHAPPGRDNGCFTPSKSTTLRRWRNSANHAATHPAAKPFLTPTVVITGLSGRPRIP
jgi:hypothetical protein